MPQNPSFFLLFLHCSPFRLPLLRVCEQVGIAGLLNKVYFLWVAQYFAKHDRPHEFPARARDAAEVREGAAPDREGAVG